MLLKRDNFSAEGKGNARKFREVVTSPRCSSAPIFWAPRETAKQLSDYGILWVKDAVVNIGNKFLLTAFTREKYRGKLICPRWVFFRQPLTIIENSNIFERIKFHHIKQSLVNSTIRRSDWHDKLMFCILYDCVHFYQRNVEERTQGESLFVFAREVDNSHRQSQLGCYLWIEKD